MAEWLLYEHDDGRHAVAPSAEAATFATGDPAWHRVGPVEVSVTPAAADQIAELKASIAYQNGLLKKWHDSASAALNELTGNVPETGWARSGYATRAVEHLRTITRYCWRAGHGKGQPHGHRKGHDTECP